jgi:hypothetical protein
MFASESTDFFVPKITFKEPKKGANIINELDIKKK